MNDRLCIDLCSGLGGFSQAFVDAGWDVVRIDIERKFRPTIQADAGCLPLRDEVGPEIILASPPCEKFSVASLSHYWRPHRGHFVPRNREAEDALRLVRRIKDEIRRLAPKKWLMENPRGMLRSLTSDPTFTITLCQYGDFRMKPTDIWGNLDFGAKKCSTQDPCHERAPRGAKTGTQGLKDSAERAKMPYGLSQAVLEAVSQP